jgi:hypothetical protein
MLKIIFTIILTSAFFILFFESKVSVISKNKKKEKEEELPSTINGFVEDTRTAFIVPAYPSQIMDRDITGAEIPIYGDVGTFVPYSTVSEDHWLHGFPHEKA